VIFVDSGAFVAWYSSDLVLSESLTLIGRKVGYRFAAARGRGLLATELVEFLRPTSQDEREALVYFEKFADQRVSFTDCVSFALMKARGVDHVFTFDRHFDLLGFERYPLH
jgi:uncharacterized protein